MAQSRAQGVAQAANAILMGLMNNYNNGGGSDGAAGTGAAGGAPLIDG